MKCSINNIIKGFKLYTKNTLWPILHFYDVTFKKELTCSIADLLLLRDGEIYNRQFYVASRLLDAKLYYQNGNDKFPYQIAVSYNFRPASYDRARRSLEFKQLLDSVKTNGYNKDSHLAIDKDLYLINGTHRIALALYFGIKELQVDCWRRRNIVERNIEHWTTSSIDPIILENVLEEFNRIQNYLLKKGESFVFWISGKDQNQTMTLISGLKPYFNFYKFYKVTLSEDKLLFFDNIEIGNGFLAQFTPIKTEYKIQKNNYYSLYVQKVEELFSKKLKCLNSKQNFYISKNCLKGQQLFELLRESLTELN